MLAMPQTPLWDRGRKNMIADAIDKLLTTADHKISMSKISIWHGESSKIIKKNVTVTIYMGENHCLHLMIKDKTVA